MDNFAWREAVLSTFMHNNVPSLFIHEGSEASPGAFTIRVKIRNYYNQFEIKWAGMITPVHFTRAYDERENNYIKWNMSMRFKWEESMDIMNLLSNLDPRGFARLTELGDSEGINYSVSSKYLYKYNFPGRYFIFSMYENEDREHFYVFGSTNVLIKYRLYSAEDSELSHTVCPFISVISIDKSRHQVECFFPTSLHFRLPEGDKHV